MDGAAELSAYVVTPGPVVASADHVEPSVLRSSRKPDSLLLLSVHERSTRVGEAAVADSADGAAGAVVCWPDCDAVSARSKLTSVLVLLDW